MQTRNGGLGESLRWFFNATVDDSVKAANHSGITDQNFSNKLNP